MATELGGEIVAQKNATPTREQAQVLEKHGLKAHSWVVVKEFQNSMIVRNRFTGEFKHIGKEVRNETNKTDVPR